MNQDEVVTLMESSKSATEWNNNCTRVQEACGGYPSFWFPAIVTSGLAARVAASFGASADIEVTAISYRNLPIHGRPTSMPSLENDERVAGVYDQGLGEKQSICSTLEEMQALYDAYHRGLALTLRWIVIRTQNPTLE